MRKLSLVLALLVCAGAGTAVAQTRGLTGRVVDGAGEPMEGVEVLAMGTTINTFTNDQGVFTISVPRHEVELVFRMIGYRRVTVTVPEGTNTVDVVTMNQDILRLDEVVVTGFSTAQQRRNLANTVATVDASDLAQVPAASMNQMLAGKMAGVEIRENSGAPGGGTRVRLRGITSIIGSGQPLYVVDGVIVSNAGFDGGMNAVSLAAGRSSISSSSQMNPVNRIADINPNDIENVEVLKGASAAAIYGSKASNGVILITTKRGRVGAPRFNLRQSFGVPTRAFSHGCGRYFTSLEDAVDAFGPQAEEYWTPNYDPVCLEDQIAGQNPLQWETSGSMSGGTETTRYYVSGFYRDEPGIVVETYAQKANLRINLDQDIGDRFTISTGAEVLRTANDRGMFGNDNSGTSYYFVLPHHPNFFDLRPTCPDGSKQVVCEGGDYPENPFVASNPLQTADVMRRDETVWRFIMSGRADWQAIMAAEHELRFSVNGGFDQWTQNFDLLSPPELFFEDDDGLPGSRVLSNANNLNTNINFNAVHTYVPGTGWLNATTSFGIQYEFEDINIARNAARGLVGGTDNLTAGESQLIEEVNSTVKDFGLFAQEELLLSERLLLTVGGRADRSSNNAYTDRFYFYPKASGSYRFEFRNRALGMFDEVKLRAAYGQTGNRPRYGQKFTTMNTTFVTNIGGLVINNQAGNAEAKPERQIEVEGGVDMQMFDGRVLVELTGYQKNVKDLLLQRSLAPSLGFTSEIFNGGEIRVRGLESVISTSPIVTTDVVWRLNGNFSLNRSKVLDLPVETFRASGGYSQGAIVIEEGESATQWVAYDTVPGTGMTDAPETFISKQGDGEPRWTAGLNSTLQYGLVTLSTTIDAQKGGLINLGTWRHWDNQKNAFDHDEIDPETGEKKGVIRRRFMRTHPRNYTRDASHIKMRELSASIQLPSSLVNSLWEGIRSANIRFSARNLFTTQSILGGDFYPGNDPAVANYNSGTEAANNVQWTREFAAYPSSKSFWLAIDLSF